MVQGPIVDVARLRAVVNAWDEVERREVIPGCAVIYRLNRRGLPRALQIHLDGWPNQRIGSSVDARIGAQSNCTLNCSSCIASQMSASRNLSVQDMVSQVAIILGVPLVDLTKLTRLRIATFALGEPMLNPEVPAALLQLREILPGAEFCVSTTGPKSGERNFAQLLTAAKTVGEVHLQLSLHFTQHARRVAFVNAGILPIEHFAEWGRRWFDVTGLKAVVNCGIGPQFGQWEDGDYERLLQLFAPEWAQIKLSVETPLDVTEPAAPPPDTEEMAARQTRLSELRFSWESYDPVGRALGAGCGGLVS